MRLKNKIERLNFQIFDKSLFKYTILYNLIKIKFKLKSINKKHALNLDYNCYGRDLKQFVSEENSKSEYFDQHMLFCCNLTQTEKKHLSNNGNSKLT